MTALDISTLTTRVLQLNVQHRELTRRLKLIAERVEKLVLDDGALREDLDRLHLVVECKRG